MHLLAVDVVYIYKNKRNPSLASKVSHLHRETGQEMQITAEKVSTKLNGGTLDL
jgi:hypothetical protein